MAWRTLIVVLAATAGCSVGARDAEGTCHREVVPLCSGGEAISWSCTTPISDSSLELMPCGADMRPGGACSQDTVVDTATPAMVAHSVTYPQCFVCDGRITGTHWTCSASGWGNAGTFWCGP